MDAKDVFMLMGSRRFARRSSTAYVDALPAAALTYSQGGEDMALFKRLKHRAQSKTPFTYVDIGCGHPHEISNTFLFYTFGWRGLCIDANADHAAAWQQHRPNDTFLSLAVGEAEGEAELFKPTGKNWGKARVGGTQNPGYMPGVTVPMRRLDSLLAQYVGDRDITLLCIDVEGGELGVLSSNNWDRWKPEVVFIECLDFRFETAFERPEAAFLIERGYTLRDKIGENLLFRVGG